MHRFASCLQQLAESPTFTRLRRRKGENPPLKSTPTQNRPLTGASQVSKPPSPLKLNFLDSHEAKPLLASLSNTQSMLSAATYTTTGIDSLANTPSLLSIARSTNCHPPPLPPIVEIAGTTTPKLDFSADAFRLSEYVVDREAALSKPFLCLPEPPVLGEGASCGRGSGAPTAYYSLSDSPHVQPFSPSSPSNDGVESSARDPLPCAESAEKGEHEKYLENLKLLRFGDSADQDKGDLFSEGFSFRLVSGKEEEEAKRSSASLSWEEIDLANYGWRV